MHVVFDRPTCAMKVFAPSGVLFGTFSASGDAWGNYSAEGVRQVFYGHDGSIAPGHYRLTRIETFPQPLASEGPLQIYVADLDLATFPNATVDERGAFSIGGVVLPVGGLAKYDRSEIMIHGGGSNLGLPAALYPMQPLLRTFGCTRMHNAELERLADILRPAIDEGDAVVFSCVGDPAMVMG